MEARQRERTFTRKLFPCRTRTTMKMFSEVSELITYVIYLLQFLEYRSPSRKSF